MMAELVGGEILERLEENGSQRFLVSFENLENLLGGLQRLVTLRVPYLGEDETSGIGGGKSDLGGHRAGNLPGHSDLNIPKWEKIRRRFSEIESRLRSLFYHRFQLHSIAQAGCGKTDEALNAAQKLHHQGADPVMLLSDLLDITHYLTRIVVAPALANNLH